MSANVKSMFYVGAVPWHGLGIAVEKAATAQEAICLAGLDWSVDAFPIDAIMGSEGIRIANQRATVRMDTKQVLGVVGRLYTPVQNFEAFSFFDNIVGEGQAVYHVAGALGEGETIWMLAKLPGEIRIDSTDDIINKYLLLTNTHNGSMSLRMFFTPVRVVCQNTLSAALSSRKSGEGIAIRHFPDIMGKVEQAKKALGLAIEFYKDAGQAYNALAKVQISEAWLGEYVNLIFPTTNEDGAASTRLQNIRVQVMHTFESPSNLLPGIKGSAWAAYNAVTEYIDHQRRIPKISQDPTNKLSSIWFGSGAEVKQRALKVALEKADISSVRSERLFASVGAL